MATRFPRLFTARTKPNHLDLPGVDRPFVHNAAAVLSGGVELGDRVVVVGGGSTGVEVAIELAESGKSVTVVDILPQIMSGCTSAERIAYGERLEELGVVVRCDHIVTEIPERLVVAVEATGNLLKIPTDSVVIAVSYTPDRELVKERTKVPGLNVQDVGDCVHPREDIRRHARWVPGRIARGDKPLSGS